MRILLALLISSYGLKALLGKLPEEFTDPISPAPLNSGSQAVLEKYGALQYVICWLPKMYEIAPVASSLPMLWWSSVHRMWAESTESTINDACWRPWRWVLLAPVSVYGIAFTSEKSNILAGPQERVLGHLRRSRFGDNIVKRSLTATLPLWCQAHSNRYSSHISLSPVRVIVMRNRTLKWSWRKFTQHGDGQTEAPL